MSEKLDAAAKACEDTAKAKVAEYEETVAKFRKAYDLASASTIPFAGFTYSRAPGKIWPKDDPILGKVDGSGTLATYGDLFKWLFDRDYGTAWLPESVLWPDRGKHIDEVTGKEEVDPRSDLAQRVPSAEASDGEEGIDDLIEAKLRGVSPELLAAYSTLHSEYRDFRLYYSWKEILEKITPLDYTKKTISVFLDRLTSKGIEELTPEKIYNFWNGILNFSSNGGYGRVSVNDIVSRNYPLKQDKFGGTAWVYVDCPWSSKDDKLEQALIDAILESSPDPSVEAKGLSASGMSASTIPGPSASTPEKYKPFVEGLVDGYQIDAKTDLPAFKIYVSDPETWKAAGIADEEEGDDSFSNVDGAEEPDEYSEGSFQGSEEEQTKLDLTLFLSQGDSEGSDDDAPSGGGGGGSDVQVGGGVNTGNSKSAGGSGERRFQKQMTINGRVVKNGELPDDLLAKLDFCSFKVEKNAARRLNELNVAYKAAFGKNLALSGGFRTFKTQNDIFDWDYYNKYGKGRKKGTNGGVAAATPGGSKHGWGQAIDCSGFGNGPGNKLFDWMEANAKKYGWVNPAWAKKSGAGYEPWHWEYIGNDLFK